MSNKPHLRPHQEKRQASQVTRLIVAILIITVFALAIALELTGHVVFRGRLILASGAGSSPSRQFPRTSAKPRFFHPFVPGGNVPGTSGRSAKRMTGGAVSGQAPSTQVTGC
jgi:hypothetical protein